MKYVEKRGAVVRLINLPPPAETLAIKNELYYLIYLEFYGANFKLKYKNLTLLDKLEEINKFVINILKEKGILNG